MRRPIVLVREAETSRGPVAVCGVIDMDTGACAVGAGAYRMEPEVGGRFGRRIGRLARKVVRSKAVRRVARTAGAVAKRYVGIDNRRAASLARVAETAREAARTETRDAARAATRLGRTLDRAIDDAPEDEELQWEAEQLGELEDEILDDAWGEADEYGGY